jgi:hypothetical protein
MSDKAQPKPAEPKPKKPALEKQIAARIGEGVAIIREKLLKLNKPDELFHDMEKMSEAEIRSILDPSKKAS